MIVDIRGTYTGAGVQWVPRRVDGTASKR